MTITESNKERLEALAASRRERSESGRGDWSSWPVYDAADEGLRDYWYPVEWSAEVGHKPVPVRVCGENLILQRDEHGTVFALNNRCPHRGVRLSEGKEEFPGTVTCAYHAWTFRLSDGELVAVITDGPDSPMCGRVSVQTYPADEALGLVWVFIGDAEPHPLETQLPEELVDAPPMAVGGRIEDRAGDWRLYAENGFDEGHAKYLHRTSYWRIFKTMPTWNKIHAQAVTPYFDSKMGQEEAIDITLGHLKQFMYMQIDHADNHEDVYLFLEYSRGAAIPVDGGFSIQG